MSRDVEVSIATLSRTLRQMAVTNKKVSKTAMERNSGMFLRKPGRNEP